MMLQNEWIIIILYYLTKIIKSIKYIQLRNEFFFNILWLDEMFIDEDIDWADLLLLKYYS